jgi:hypothetical protein
MVITIMSTILSSRNKFVHGEHTYQPVKSVVAEHMANLELPVIKDRLVVPKQYFG